MTFASPNWAWLLFILPALALLKIAADAHAHKVTTLFASSERLRAVWLTGNALVRSGVRFGLQLLGVGFFIIALTRPQWGDEEKKIEQSGRNILIAVDTSKSMLADDISPNRLARTKLAMQDLLEKLPGDRVGLIAFAGRAFLQAPLTTDHEAVVESIQSLDHTTIPRGGSSQASAINLAIQTVEKMPGHQHGLIIFSDGQETDESMEAAAKLAKEKNILILPVGVGTAEGALIPDPNPQNQGDFIRDESGNVVKSRLEAAALQEIAQITGGEYVELNSQALTQTLVDRLLSNLDRHRAESRQLTRPIERYQWPLFAGIVFLLMSLIIHPSASRPVRQAVLPVDPQTAVHQPPPLPAMRTVPVLIAFLAIFSAATMGATREELAQARRYYDDSHFDHARDSYRNMTRDKVATENLDEAAYGLGAAAFKMKDYEQAERSFSDALQSQDKSIQLQSHRGLGTSLYDQGDSVLAKQPERTIKMWTDAISHFEAGLKMTAEGSQPYTELKENRDFIKKRLEELKQQQEQQKQQQQQQNKDKQKGQGKGDGKPEDQPSEGGDQPQEPRQEGDEKKTDAMQKEQNGALPEGEIRAGEGGKPEDKDSGKTPDEIKEEKHNDQTGFSPHEARSQLRNYADDQKSVQYLMREEKPAGGKDY